MKKVTLLSIYVALATVCWAQAPSITYPASSKTYTLNSAITPFQPTNTGGEIQYTSTVSTLAGNGVQAYVDGTGTAAQFFYPAGITTDAAGNVYVADKNNHRIRKITIAGVVTTLAGSGTAGYADGVAGEAMFNEPEGIAVDVSGNVYIAEDTNSRIRKITPAGLVTTLAGSGIVGFADGTGTEAMFDRPRSLAIDAAGNLYVGDYINHRIRKITPDGVVSTFAGSTQGYADGTGTAAMFYKPHGIAIDAAGNLYVSDCRNNRIRKITPERIVTTLAGNGTASYVDGIGTDAMFSGPMGISIDAAGNVYVADYGNNCIRKVTPQGLVSTLAGSGTQGYLEGVGTLAQFSGPWGVATAPSGNVFVADPNNIRVRKIIIYGYSISPALPAGLSFDASTGTISGTPTATLIPTTYNVTATNTGGTSSTSVTIAVNPSAPSISYPTSTKTCTVNSAITPFLPTNSGGAVTVSEFVTTLVGSSIGFTDGTGTSALFKNPTGITTDTAGNIYVADMSNNCIRKITSTGVVTTLAGNGTPAFVNGTGTDVQFNSPYGIATDAIGNIYVADFGNNSIRKITSAGVVTSLAGNGTPGYTNGAGTTALFKSPSGVAIDAAGYIYVADTWNHCIRKITSAGVVTTLAGNGTSGYTNGAGTTAQFNAPVGITIDAAGNLYVADYYNNCIRKITTTGIVTTLAGSTTSGYSNGIGSNATFHHPSGVSTDAIGNVYVVDCTNNQIRKITPTGIVTTIAGTGIASYADGNGIAAGFNNPIGVAIDAAGYIYVADTYNQRIRKIALCGYSISPALPAGLSFDASTGTISGTPTATLTPTTYTVTATNTGGTSSTSFTIAVNPKAPSISYLSNSRTFTVNLAITPFQPTNTGGAVPATIPGTVTTFAGSGTAGFADGIGVDAQFNNPYGVAADADGNIYVADSKNSRIRKITLAGVVSTLAGSNIVGSADGTGISAQFNNPYGIATDMAGNVYVADDIDQRIRKINPLGVVTTLAGSGTAGFVDGIGTSAQFYYPNGIDADVEGNLYVAEYSNNSIRKITSSGVVSTFAGGTNGAADGTSISAQFNHPHDVATDAVGNVYVADGGNNCIRKISPTGVVTTFAGSGTAGYADGVGTSAQFSNSSGIATDVAGNVYVADFNNRIRKITPSGVVTTLAGNGIQGYADGVGVSAQFSGPKGLITDAVGNVYVADAFNNRIRKVLVTGYSISPALPAGLSFDATTGTISGTPTELSLTGIYTVTATNEGGTSSTSVTIAVTNTPIVTTNGAVGTGSTTATASGTIVGLGVDANPTAYGFCYSTTNTTPTTSDYVINKGAVSATGNYTAMLSGLTPENLYYIRAYATNINGTSYGEVAIFNTVQIAPVISYSVSYKAYPINTAISPLQPVNTGGAVPATVPGTVTTFAGSGTAGYADGSDTQAEFQNVADVATDAAGNVYVADMLNNRIRKITPVGMVTTLAGSGIGGSADGTRTTAQFYSPRGITIDGLGNVYVSDRDNHCIRKITPAGMVTTLAGNGTAGYADGIGTAAQFSSPVGINTDLTGNVYVGDRENNRIRKITHDGVVTTFAGSGTVGYLDGTGIAAQFIYPRGVVTDASGNMYVADAGNQRIRKITSSGVVTTLAGNGSYGFADGTGVTAQFYDPFGIAIDAIGNIYVADANNQRIRKITSAGVVTTLAGSTSGFVNGIGSTTQFSTPAGVASDGAGNVFVADYLNNCIRKIITCGYSISPSLPTGLNFDATTGTISGTPTATTSPTIFTITATNSGGTSSTSFTLAISTPAVWTGTVSTDWDTAGNWDINLVPTATNDVLIPNTTNKPIIGYSTCNTLTINSGATITIPTGKGLHVIGSIINNAGVAGIVIQSGANVTNGTLLFHNAPEAPVPATVEMYSKASWDLNAIAGSKYRWQFFGVPVRSIIASPTLDGAVVRRAEESGNSSASRWVQLAGTDALTSFTGYEIVQATATKYTFTGLLENSSPTKTLTYTTGATYPGLQIVGNPYTAAIDIKQLVFGSQTEGSVYLYNTGSLNDWNINTGNTAGANPGQYTASTKATAGSGGIPGQIPSMQAFVVKAMSNNAAATLDIPYSSVVTTNVDKQRAPQVDTNIYSIIDVKGSRYGDRMWIFTNPSCTRSYDNGWDARKMFGSTLTPQLCAMESDGDYQIDAVADINNTELGFMPGEDADYTLSFTHYNVEGTYAAFYLVDLLNNKTVDITTTGAEYAFSAVPSTTLVKRFKIISTAAIPTDASNPNTGNIRIFSFNKTIVAHNTSSEKGNLMICDVTGRFVQSIAYGANNITSTATTLKPGTYIVKAMDGNKVVAVSNVLIR